LITCTHSSNLLFIRYLTPPTPHPHNLHSTSALALNPQYGKAYIRRADSSFFLGGKDNLQKSMNDYQKALDLENEEKNVESIKTKLKRVSNYELFYYFYLNFLLYFYFYYRFCILYSSHTITNFEDDCTLSCYCIIQL
jgi:hypothetical protein